ncbi:MAG: cytochrome c3 family protein [Pseudomonadota bacterium]
MMKKSILIAAAFGLVAVGSAQAQNSTTGSFNAPAGTGIVGSKHDLSTTTGIGGLYGPADALDRICIYCHAPHHAMQEADAAGIKYLPLWNHGVTTQFYNTYESDFGDGPAESGLAGVGVDGDADQFADRHLFNGRATIGEPGSVSRLCLSCHDGTVAVNEYGRDPQRDYSQNGGGAAIADQFKIGGGGNLVNHHPIGFSYLDVATVDDEIADPDTLIGANGTTIRSLLYAGEMMECVTCHDVHNTQNTGETFLWKSDRESKFCLTCHEK